MRWRCSTLVAVLVAWPSFVAGEPATLSPDDVLRYIRHLVPLPKKLEMTAAVDVPVGGVRIASGEDHPLARQAVKELQECLGGAGAEREASFTLTLRTAGPDAAEFRDLPHRDQAYAIAPTGGSDGLLLTGGGQRGLYYAAKTAQQLLRAGMRDGRVRIPLVRITDWPDLEDRGLWGGDVSDHVRWLSDRKMNYLEHISSVRVDKDKRCSVGYPPYKQRMLDEGPTYGINAVPVILHLEQLSGSGIFEAYPELRGKDGREGTICYANPAFADVLAEWLLLWRSRPGVTEVDVWMTENLAGQKGCQCAGCRDTDRNVMEVRAILAAWKKALRKEPSLKIRVLTSEETEKSNPAVFAELPKDVKIWYYHSLFTYNTTEERMIRPYLVNAVKEGRWIGVCCNLCARVGFWQPFTGAHFIHYRMNEFVSKGLAGLLGYATPTIHHTRFNTEAAAEWSWNAKGRSPREFAVSWAVRQGMKDPEKFADWSDTLGPVAWDIYGSDWPSGEKRKNPGTAAGLLQQGKLPELGSSLWGLYPMPWGDIKSVEQLMGNAARADRALQLARELGDTSLIQESLVVQGYSRALVHLWQLKQLVKDGRVADAQKAAARDHFAGYLAALRQAADALTRWEATLPTDDGKSRYTAAVVKDIGEMIEEMRGVAASLGCEPK